MKDVTRFKRAAPGIDVGLTFAVARRLVLRILELLEEPLLHCLNRCLALLGLLLFLVAARVLERFPIMSLFLSVIAASALFIIFLGSHNPTLGYRPCPRKDDFGPRRRAV